MNVEDLKKMKEELEKQNKYVIVPYTSERGIENASEPKLAGELLASENTDEVVKQCELLIENATRYLASNGIPFDQLVITSDLGVICRANYVEKWKELCQKNVEEDEFKSFKDELHYQVIPNVVPVSFRVNSVFTGTVDCDLVDYADAYGYDLKDLCNKCVSGIVNWEKFVMQMKSLGYNIEFMNYDKGVFFYDYIETIKENDFDTEIDVIADLGRTKKSSLPKM